VHWCLQLPLGPGGGRVYVRGQDIAEHLRAIPRWSTPPTWRSVSGRGDRAGGGRRAPGSAHVVGHMDPTPWTVTGESRRGGTPAIRLRGLSNSIGRSDPNAWCWRANDRCRDEDFGDCRLELDRDRQRRSSRAHAAAPPLVRSPSAGGSGRTCHSGCRHRRRCIPRPGHGLDDYIVGRRYGLEIDNPVGGDGRFLPSTPLFAGEQVFDANAHVIKVLHDKRPRC